jgi:hypothetical protein
MAKHIQPMKVESIESSIHYVRGQKVMLDSDLAAIYGVTTTRLNEQLKRNRKRFPIDFAFQLKRQELASLMSQFAISKTGRGGRRKLPWVIGQDEAIKNLFDAIRELLNPAPPKLPRREIGFHIREEARRYRISNLN